MKERNYANVQMMGTKIWWEDGRKEPGLFKSPRLSLQRGKNNLLEDHTPKNKHIRQFLVMGDEH